MLIVSNWTYSKKGPGRPPVMKKMTELVVRMATENHPGKRFLSKATYLLYGQPNKRTKGARQAFLKDTSRLPSLFY